MHIKKRTSGFSLIETVIATAVLAALSFGIYQAYIAIIAAVKDTQFNTVAALIANENIELVRNLTYDDVGILGGLPTGVLPFKQEISRDNATFTVTTFVRSIDDPFDGQIGSTTNNDLAPADYKFVEFVVSCETCPGFSSSTFSTIAAPKNLETSGGNGALFIQVFDADGFPVQGADVWVQNASSSPTITINEVTNSDGLLQLVDVPPGFQVYKASTTKNGFSEDVTYEFGEPSNPNPSKPHATVASGTVTQLSFAIDELATAQIKTQTQTCNAVSGVDFTLRSSKLIGASPDVPKYFATSTTDGGGNLTLSNMEWDNYTLDLAEAGKHLSGTSPILLLTLTPGATEDVTLMLQNANQKGLLVSVLDGGSGLPLSDATVTISSGSGNQTKVTSRGHIKQSDWSGGSGQATSTATTTDETRYFTDDGNVEINSPAGDLKLEQILGDYVSSGWVESSTFDTGATNTVYYNLSFSPETQPLETGTTSVRFQLATNNDTETWNFIGPDGTGGTFYTSTSTSVHSSHDNDQFMRYRAYLSTATTTFTPTLSDFGVTFGSDCVPFGQVFFNGLATDDYTVSVSKPGYEDTQTVTTVDQDWQYVSLSVPLEGS